MKSYVIVALRHSLNSKDKGIIYFFGRKTVPNEDAPRYLGYAHDEEKCNKYTFREIKKNGITIFDRKQIPALSSTKYDLIGVRLDDLSKFRELLAKYQ